MARPSTAASAEQARAAIDANVKKASKIPPETLIRLERLRLENVISVSAKMYKTDLDTMRQELHDSPTLIADLERFTELLFRRAQRAEVYGRAMEAILNNRLDDYVASVGRQLYHATLQARADSPMVSVLMRVYYVQARAEFLKECQSPNEHSYDLLRGDAEKGA